MLAINLPEEAESRLKALAKATGKSKADHAREAIIEHLDDLEDYYKAKKRLEDIRAGRSTTIPLDEVLKEYGLDSKF